MDALKVPNGLLPIMKVLMEAFPWVDTSNSEEFQVFTGEDGFALLLIPGNLNTEIIVQNKDPFHAELFLGGYFTTDEFRLDDPAEAVGVVSVFVERLVKKPPRWFKEPLELRQDFPFQDMPARIILMSPSQKKWRSYEQTACWRPIAPWHKAPASLYVFPHIDPKDFPGVPACIGDLLTAGKTE